MDKIIKEFLDDKGKSPFGNWFNHLNAQAAAKITTALYRLEQGNTSQALRV
jgi:putative component of toxin-antitoxin plasmid stabilization module